MPINSAPASIAVSVSEVQQHLQNAIIPIDEFQSVALEDGLNRILAHDVISPFDLPAFDNSAMDGFAFCANDAQRYQQLKLVGQSLAGHPFAGPLLPGQAVHITTGASIPAYADSVLPHEQAQLIGTSTLNMTGIEVRTGQHRRRRGEEIAAGSVAVGKGRRIGPAELGIFASLGFASIPVHRKLRVAIFSTGDELRSADRPLDTGCVYDSNRITLNALLRRFGADVVDLGVLADSEDAIELALKNCSNQVDVIITSGGVSTGAADFTKQVLQKLGQMNFWSIDMRPGRPLAFGRIAINDQIESTYVFGLPGNPVAMMISYYFFVRPALQQLAGAELSMPPLIEAIATESISKKAGRTEFQRGIFGLNTHGQLSVSITGAQGSSMLSSMARANCLVVLPPEQDKVNAGERIKILLLGGLQD